MVTDRQRVRVGRDVAYQPTAAEAAAGGGAAGDIWSGRITAVNPDGTVGLIVFKANGVVLSLTGVHQGSTAGTFSTRGLAAVA